MGQYIQVFHKPVLGWEQTASVVVVPLTGRVGGEALVAHDGFVDGLRARVPAAGGARVRHPGRPPLGRYQVPELAD